MMLGFLIRLMLVVGLLLTGLAIHLGRSNPSLTSRRTPSAATHGVLNKALTDYRGGGPRYLDQETGRLGMIPFDSGSTIDRASLSPWVDRGSRQVVGVESSDSLVALVRLSWPGGDLLDRVALTAHALPNSPPCWFPGKLAMVLYAGTDGRIYRVDFEAARLDGQIQGAAEVRPRALVWKAPIPEGCNPRVIDLSWPIGDRLGGRLLATICQKGGNPERYLEPRLWWLGLDREGTSVVESGPILGATPAVEGENDGCRMPLLFLDEGRSPCLAYLTKDSRRPGHQLRVAPIRTDPDSGAPTVRAYEIRTLAYGCLLSAPVVSKDGRWFTVLFPDATAVRAGRIAVEPWAPILARSP